jgi:hypothetical protein
MQTTAVLATSNLPVEARPAFGRCEPVQDALTNRSVTELLYRRLAEKSENYDRAAARLEFRGDTDSAHVLRMAAWRLRKITRSSPAEREAC